MKVFISYHLADTSYKNILVDYLKQINVNYYAVPENYDFDEKYHQDIASIIIENMEYCDVTICLLGKDTYSRPHVDHELKATLKGGFGIRKGLVGIMLESREDNVNNLDANTLPLRIVTNCTEEFPYVEMIQFASVLNNLIGALNQAQENRSLHINVKNNMHLMKLRHSKYYGQ